MKSKPNIFVVVGVVLVIGLFVFFKPKTAANNDTQVLPINTTKTFVLVVKDKKLVFGQKTLKVLQGDTVIIKMTVSEPEELHLHGYDKSLDLETEVQGTLTFEANLSGKFPFELEKSGTELGDLVVEPK